MPARVTGTVANFHKQRGFGYINLEGSKKKEDQIFVHWKNISSDSRWPSLAKGQEVQFTIKTEDGKKKAFDVTDVDGDSIEVENDRTLVKGGPYRGSVKFYDAKKGWGFIKPHDKIKGNGKEDLHFIRSEIVTASSKDSPFVKDGQKVRFEVTKDKKGKFIACEVKLANGKPIVNPRGAAKSAKKQGGWKKQAGWKRTRSQMGGSIGGKLAKLLKLDTDSDTTKKAEIGIAMPKSAVGGIIGKKGAKIRKIIKSSKARVDFGDEDFEIGDRTYRVLAISGETEACTKAAKAISEARSRAAESLDARMVFLCPAEWCGMLIGKKGENIKKVAKTKGFLKVDVSDNEIELPGAGEVNTVTLFGGQETVKAAIEKLVKVLGTISQRKREKQLQELVWDKLSAFAGPRAGNSGRARRRVRN